MKLQELGAQRQSERIAQVIESRLGSKIKFKTLNENRARKMLAKVRGLLKEHRSSPAFHHSERDPAYLQLVMMEQGLTSHIKEQGEAMAMSPMTPQVGTVSQNPAAAAQARQQAQAAKNQLRELIKAKQQEILDLQKQMNSPQLRVAESRRKLKESELQQAQVVMAAQDMVDQIQKMMEQVSAMQFKDLPALTDAIKNDMGQEQATSFQSQAAAALTTLLAAAQEGKTQMEAAQGTLTGQAPVVPGVDDMAPAADDIGTDSGIDDIDTDLSLDANLPADEPEAEPKVALGRERR
jgi:hypothetical protein